MKVPTGQSHVCKECSEEIIGAKNSLGRHIRKEHNMTYQKYLEKHEFGGAWPTCQCGCGQKIRYKKGIIPRFIKGHSSNGENNGMYGKKGELCPTFGVPKPEGFGENQSSVMKRRWNDPNDKLQLVHESEEYVKKQSDTLSKRIEEGTFVPKSRIKKIINPHTQEEEILAGYEIEFYQACTDLDFSLRLTKNHHFRIPYVTEDTGSVKNYLPDFYFPDLGLIVEVKGKYEKYRKYLKEKTEAANKWCSETGNTFLIFDCLTRNVEEEARQWIITNILPRRGNNNG